MGRTNIEIDDRLIGRVMERYGLRTKREAVDLGLRRLVDGIEPLSAEQFRELRGSGWGDDGLELAELRDGEPIERL